MHLTFPPTYYRYDPSGELEALHRDRWEDQWAEAGVELEMEGEQSGTDMPLPAMVNASLHALLSSARADWPLGLAAGGLTQGGWGHVRWGK